MGSIWKAMTSGTVFGAGLALAQMTNPAKVKAFLDVAGAWDPSLAFVMGAALLVSAVSLRMTGGSRPAPASGSIDARLLGGAALFGVGWGLGGFCPGPAIASLSTGSFQVALFVCAMLAGMGLFTLLPASQNSSESAPVGSTGAA